MTEATASIPFLRPWDAAATRAAQARSDLADAQARGDKDGAERAVADLAVWWTVAHAQGATAADIREHCAGGAR